MLKAIGSAPSGPADDAVRDASGPDGRVASRLCETGDAAFTAARVPDREQRKVWTGCAARTPNSDCMPAPIIRISDRNRGRYGPVLRVFGDCYEYGYTVVKSVTLWPPDMGLYSANGRTG